MRPLTLEPLTAQRFGTRYSCRGERASDDDSPIRIALPPEGDRPAAVLELASVRPPRIRSEPPREWPTACAPWTYPDRRRGAA